MTICKPSALVVVRVCPTGYSMGIGGKHFHRHSPAMTAAQIAEWEARLKDLGARANRELDERLLAITGSSDPKVHQTWSAPKKSRKA